MTSADFHLHVVFIAPHGLFYPKLWQEWKNNHKNVHLCVYVHENATLQADGNSDYVYRIKEDVSNRSNRDVLDYLKLVIPKIRNIQNMWILPGDASPIAPITKVMGYFTSSNTLPANMIASKDIKQFSENLSKCSQDTSLREQMEESIDGMLLGNKCDNDKTRNTVGFLASYVSNTSVIRNVSKDIKYFVCTPKRPCNVVNNRIEETFTMEFLQSIFPRYLIFRRIDEALNVQKFD
jgi:hypothetical protein